ncbi:MAG: hypothetical protein V7603_1478 [Micromonosporaceae bacterium]
MNDITTRTVRRVDVGVPAAEAMTLAVTADPARLGRRDAEAVLRAAEALLVRAVHERVALREVPELVARALDGRR